jgi:hypothetical protein
MPIVLNAVINLAPQKIFYQGSCIVTKLSLPLRKNKTIWHIKL